jgi:ubiquinone/menaquinone biosynthesis C-methylase UbiE
MNQPLSQLEKDNDAKPEVLSDAYVKLFSHKKIVRNYRNKFNSRIEKIRHLCEVKQLEPHVSGKLLDCSVGTGRLIPHFSQVTEFYAADTSPEFLEYVKKTYPFVNVKQGDLREPLQYETGTFDTVFSMRTLFAIGSISGTINEMARVCKIGGNFIFDYQNIPNRKNSKNKQDGIKTTNKWHQLVDFQESPDEILDSMTGVTYTKYPLDMFLHYIKSGAKSLNPEYTKSTTKRGYLTLLKKHLLYRFFNSRFNILPDKFLVYYERLSYKHPALSLKPKKVQYCRRYLYVCQKTE